MTITERFASENWWQAPGNCVAHTLHQWLTTQPETSRVIITVDLDPESRVRTVTVTGEDK